MPSVEVFADLSGMPRGRARVDALSALESPGMLGAIADRVHCAAPRTRSGARTFHREGWNTLATGAIDSCNRAIESAARAERPLLVLLGYVEPGCDAIGVLLDALDEDPMIGFAVPRLRGAGDDSLAPLGDGGDRAIDELPRRLLAEVPATYLVADAPARCFLIKPQVLANFGELDSRFRTVSAALWHYVGRARRCGFRTVVCNRAVVGAGVDDSGRSCTIALRELPEADRVLLRELLPDVERTFQEFGTRAVAPSESRLARALPHLYGAKPSLLLDVRNIGRATNGTAVAALGIAGGLHALDCDWDVALLARQEACAAHQLEDLFPGWRVYTAVPDRQFTVALRLSQPWHVQEMIELHALAAFNLYLFLDTISWDVGYAAPRHLDATWRFMADHADGLVFISEFTRDRFRRRFASPQPPATLVSHLSFEAADYVHPDVPVTSDRDGPILVIGNAYDHKDVAETIALLAAAFPYEPIVALGPAPAPTPRVTVLESGTVSELELHQLYASARIVVFPSFYEGFGFPVVTTLAYGGTLLARHSAVLEEIVARCASGGRVVPYTRRDELVELVGRVLHGERVPELSSDTGLRAARPHSWRDVAATILRFAEDLSADLWQSRWRTRDRTVQQLLAARGESVLR
jgi:glycosyltransferase involved in cell wall biosynthesis